MSLFRFQNLSPHDYYDIVDGTSGCLHTGWIIGADAMRLRIFRRGDEAWDAGAEGRGFDGAPVRIIGDDQ